MYKKADPEKRVRVASIQASNTIYNCKLIMETTFISIHDLSQDARLLYVSTSIVDILGYSPLEVIGKSCWEYFHPDEIPFARAIHGRGVQLDKAAVLNYCQVRNKDGRWVGCECVFTVVHDVLVASTSIYRRGSKSQKRAKDAPIIRQLFSSSPRDPRYHMLQYISHKFSQELRPNSHEPRAALFLNRFTRTLTIMYATNGLADTLGISAEELNGKSFYYCIQENCLQEAVRCLESAKANDSIAYLRFWFRDPRQDSRTDSDESMEDNHSSGDEDDGGVQLENRMGEDNNEHRGNEVYSNSFSRASMDRGPTYSMDRDLMDPNSRSSSGTSTDLDGQGNDLVFEHRTISQSSNSSVEASDEGQPSCRPSQFPRSARIELEAVVSCTSDGLVVIIRRARSIVPQVAQPAAEPVEHPYANGFFASPWALDPIIPEVQNRPRAHAAWLQNTHSPAQPTPFQASSGAAHGPESEDFMKSIREVAVFAWALTGINGSLAQYGRGESRGESQPPGGLPVWQPDANVRPDSEPYNRVNTGSEWSDSNEYQNRYHKGASNTNSLGYEIGNGGSCRKPCDFQEGVPANGGSGNSQWAYGASGEVQPWDRLYSNERAARYEVGRYDEMR